MHINWTTSVPVPQYPKPKLRNELNRRIAAATDDDLLAAYLHWTEGRVAVEQVSAATALEGTIEREQGHLGALRMPAGTLFWVQYAKARHALDSELARLGDASGAAARTARLVWEELRKGTTEDLRASFKQRPQQQEAPAERLGPLMDQIGGIDQALNRAMRVYREAMHDVALREHDLHAFVASQASIALEDIHTMSPAAFEQMVAALASRDGHTILRSGGRSGDLGADVITVAPDGSRMVLQCKHRHGGQGKVGSPDIQTLNGTARPEHKADIVVAVTNGTFTKPAREFADNHDINLIGGALLRRWATWGEPLLSVLGVGDPETGSSGTTWWRSA
ncbi:restriction endonuclease [Streptomyces sp. NBC_01214]|uniref:restriction endonuclease n=1 Tax=Streptomyces sp. NBC_01214 TaxID=2903777 RepID=UPI002252FA2E|nr:restriction endonuclease [Streptomyces sp. NBC_01214]MCX4808762.1 restriction endonuclease [Streptomyces sp. NBC_01214]